MKRCKHAMPMKKDGETARWCTLHNDLCYKIPYSKCPYEDIKPEMEKIIATTKEEIHEDEPYT